MWGGRIRVAGRVSTGLIGLSGIRIYWIAYCTKDLRLFVFRWDANVFCSFVRYVEIAGFCLFWHLELFLVFVFAQEFWVGNEELVDMYEKGLGDAGYINFKLARTNNRGDGMIFGFLFG